jgi:hypothetical protein
MIDPCGIVADSQTDTAANCNPTADPIDKPKFSQPAEFHELAREAPLREITDW